MQCKANKADGTPCGSPFAAANGFCVAHGPGGRGVMRERGQRGAEATRRTLRGRGTVKAGEAPAAPETINDARLIAAWATRAVLTGEIDPKIAQQVVGLLREFRGALKEAEMEREIRELRAVVADLKGKRGRS